MNVKLKSRYITDVEIADRYIEIIDSQHLPYYIDKTSSAYEDFKNWFKNVFIRGIPQFLTVFEYKTVDVSDSEVKCVVTRIHDNWT